MSPHPVPSTGSTQSFSELLCEAVKSFLNGRNHWDVSMCIQRVHIPHAWLLNTYFPCVHTDTHTHTQPQKQQGADTHMNRGGQD